MSNLSLIIIAVLALVLLLALAAAAVVLLIVFLSRKRSSSKNSEALPPSDVSAYLTATPVSEPEQQIQEADAPEEKEPEPRGDAGETAGQTDDGLPSDGDPVVIEINHDSFPAPAGLISDDVEKTLLSEDDDEDENILAVIAAVVAYMGFSEGKTYSIRNIRRVKRAPMGRSAWAYAGVIQNTRPF